MPDETLSAGPFDRQHPWQLIGRAALLMIAAGVFLILMSSVASALDVPGADTVSDTAGTATDTVSDTAGTATDTAGTATDTVSDTAGTVSDTAGTAIDTAGTATDTVSDTAGTVGSVTGAIGDTAGGLTDAAGDAVGTLTDTVGDTAGTLGSLNPVESLGGVVDGLVGGVDVGEVVPTSPDGSDPPIGSTDPPTTAAPRGESRNVPSPLAHESMRTTVLQPSVPTNVHQTSTSASRPDAGGAEPGPVPVGGLPFPLDAAAAALSSLTEVGGTSLVWAFLALLVLLPVMDDRWLRFVLAAPPHAPLVAPDGRPG
jgi:hypothetical protein